MNDPANSIDPATVGLPSAASGRGASLFPTSASGTSATVAPADGPLEQPLPTAKLPQGRQAMDQRVEEPHTRAARRSLATLPLRVLALGAIGAVLYYGHAAFVPVVLAMLFSLVLTTPVEALHRHGLPRGLGALLILLSLLALLGGAVNLVWTPAQSWWQSA